MTYHIVIAGAGPSALAFALGLKEARGQYQDDIEVTILERNHRDSLPRRSLYTMQDFLDELGVDIAQAVAMTDNHLPGLDAYVEGEYNPGFKLKIEDPRYMPILLNQDAFLDYLIDQVPGM